MEINGNFSLNTRVLIMCSDNNNYSVLLTNIKQKIQRLSVLLKVCTLKKMCSFPYYMSLSSQG